MKAIIASFAVAIAAGAALAEDQVFASEPKSLVDALAVFDHTATLHTLESGQQSLRVSGDGMSYHIDFVDCATDRTECRSLLFAAWLRPTPDLDLTLFNDWNNAKLFTKSYYMPGAYPRLDMAVPAAGALSMPEFRRLVAIWVAEVRDFDLRVNPG